MVNINGIEYPTLMPDEYWERILGSSPKYKEQKKAIEDFFDKYKDDIENNNISRDDAIITSTIKEANNILSGNECRHLVNITYDYATSTYVSYCTLCGKILDTQTLDHSKSNKPKMLSESKVTKIGKKDKNSIKKDKNNNTRK